MVGMTDLTANAALDTLITGYPYLALFTATGNDAGAGFTEALYPGYARVNTTGLWAAAVGSAPSTKQNNATISFPAATGTGLDCVAIGLFSASTAGNLGFWGYPGNFDWKPTSFAVGTPGVLTQPAHGYVNGDRVIGTTEYGSEGTVPAGLTALATVAGVTTDTFNVGVTTTTTGGLMMRKVAVQSIINGLVVRFLSGQLIIKL